MSTQQKVFIMTDAEGVAGVVGKPLAEGAGNSLDVEFAGKMLAAEVNAAVEG